MRKFVKTVAVLALAVSVLSTSAFAAISGGSVVDGTTAGTYTASVTDAAEGEQVTLLATEASALTDVTDSNIYYIDQNAEGTFTNFQLKDGTAGKRIYFFAGSATSDEAKQIGILEFWTVGLAASEAEVEAGNDVALTTSISPLEYDGTPTWTVTKDGTDVTTTTLIIAEDGKSATFNAEEAGDYVVSFNINETGVEAKSVTITVTKPSYVLTKTTQIVKTEPGAEAIAKDQYGIGAVVDVVVPEGKEFEKFVMVFVAGTDRYYSDAVEFTGTTGAVKVAIAAPNGNGKYGMATINVDSVDAIFKVKGIAEGTEGSAYYTNEVDAENYGRVITE